MGRQRRRRSDDRQSYDFESHRRIRVVRWNLFFSLLTLNNFGRCPALAAIQRLWRMSRRRRRDSSSRVLLANFHLRWRKRVQIAAGRLEDDEYLDPSGTVSDPRAKAIFHADLSPFRRETISLPDALHPCIISHARTICHFFAARERLWCLNASGLFVRSLSRFVFRGRFNSQR